MAFSSQDRAALLAVKGVGPTVVQRLEQIGIGDLAELADRDPHEICAAASELLGSTCWRNSPQARSAIAAAIEMARAAAREIG